MGLLKKFGEQVSSWVDGRTERLEGAKSESVSIHPEFGAQVCFFFGTNAKGNPITAYAKPEGEGFAEGDEYPVENVVIVERINADTKEVAKTMHCRIVN